MRLNVREFLAALLRYLAFDEIAFSVGGKGETDILNVTEELSGSEERVLDLIVLLFDFLAQVAVDFAVLFQLAAEQADFLV